MNKVIISGKLVNDPVIYNANEKNKITAKYTLAVNDHSSTDYIDCTAFCSRAYYVQKHLHKDTIVNVIGTLKHNNYTNRNGIKTYSLEVIVQEQELGIKLDNNLTFSSETAEYK